MEGLLLMLNSTVRQPRKCAVVQPPQAGPIQGREAGLLLRRQQALSTRADDGGALQPRQLEALEHTVRHPGKDDCDGRVR